MEYKEIKIIGVDKEHVEREATQINAFKYPFILNAKPDDLWTKFLHQAYRLSSFGKKRQYVVLGNSINMIVFSDDNMQAQLDNMKELIAIANADYLNMVRRKDEERREEEERKQKERETIERLKNDADKLNFG